MWHLRSTSISKVCFSTKGFKQFIGCKDDEKIKLLCIMLQKINRYAKNFDEASI